MTKIDVVKSLSTPLESPSSLGEHCAKLWRSILKQYRIEDAGGLAILEKACISRDRSTTFAAIIAKDGPVVRTQSGSKEHPLLKAEREERALEARLLQRLGLNVEAVRSVGRPGNTVGVSWEKFHGDNEDAS